MFDENKAEPFRLLSNFIINLAKLEMKLFCYTFDDGIFCTKTFNLQHLTQCTQKNRYKIVFACK